MLGIRLSFTGAVCIVIAATSYTDVFENWHNIRLKIFSLIFKTGIIVITEVIFIAARLKNVIAANIKKNIFNATHNNQLIQR